ncbi:hypothetical protein AHF37_09730 [Paragonimus kellicotti]|nr:hypothetical protein AHF37_09730 [Paragonimus kellicotti]
MIFFLIVFTASHPPMESADAFEWELSKENVAQLHGGRSVALLNKILSAQNSGEFLNKRQQLRQYRLGGSLGSKLGRPITILNTIAFGI